MFPTPWNSVWSNVSTRPLRKASIAAVALVAVGFQSANGANILIDNFVTPQSATATAGAPVASSSTLAAEAIGGERDMLVDLISGDTALSLSVNPFGGEFLIHDSGTAVKGSSTTVWDGPDGDPTSLDPTGLGGIDLTGGGPLDAIRLNWVLADLTGSISLTVYDASDATGDTWSQAVFNLPGGIFAPIDIEIPYTDFTNVGANGAADFTDVGAISMEIRNVTTGSLDVLFSSIYAVPEPSAGLLSLLGLAGVIAPLRRLRRK